MAVDVDKKISILARKCKQAEEELKVAEAEYKKAKREFSDAMLEHYCDSKRKTFVTDSIGGSTETITATKVERTHIEWFPEKLEKRLERSIAKQVLKKTYTIPNLPLLAKYLKAHNVDPKVFASYLEITKEVDVDALERLSDVGKIEARNIAGCYIVKTDKPYYRLTFKTVGGEDGEE